MEKYITNFDTVAELSAFSATTDFGEPHVSLTKDNSDVHFFRGPYGSHEYVIINGLKWSKMNLGAKKDTEYGLYFQWGDTQGYTYEQVGSGEGQKPFDWADYKFTETGETIDPDNPTLTKYNETDGKTVLDDEDDAAKVMWGGAWRIPTPQEFEALGSATTTAWTESYKGVSNLKGIILTAKENGAELFLPACGGCSGGTVHQKNIFGGCWSNTLTESEHIRAHGVGFGSTDIVWGDNRRRFGGFTIRPVAD